MGNNINDGYADSNRFSDKALLIYNDFLHSGKFLTHYKWLKNAAETYDIKLELMGNSEFLSFIEDKWNNRPQIDFLNDD